MWKNHLIEIQKFKKRMQRDDFWRETTKNHLPLQEIKGFHIYQFYKEDIIERKPEERERREKMSCKSGLT